MFSKNLKYYRLKKQLTKKQLAEIVNVSPMLITYYENGDRKPSMETIKKLAQALDVRVSDFLSARNEQLVFAHGEFRKNVSLSKARQEYVRESVEEYFSRFMTVTEILGGDVISVAPKCHVLPLSDDDEENALALRTHLGFAADGPIEDLIGKLENKGVLIYECNIGNAGFSGMNGLVNGRPYIVFNPVNHTERNRTTIGHELAHLMFQWPEDMDDKLVEKRATAISGAFLFPKQDAFRELGVYRRFVSKDMAAIAKEYGISMNLLVKRAELLGIVKQATAKDYFINAGRKGWRGADSKEPSRIQPENPTLFEQLVYRAVNEEEISIQRGAELLKKSFSDVKNACSWTGA